MAQLQLMLDAAGAGQQRIALGQQPVFQVKTNTRALFYSAMLQQMVHDWEYNVIVAANNMREVKREHVRQLNSCDKYLTMQTLLPLVDLKLGDQVKICLKQRQFKQVCKGGWNSLMGSASDKLGRVIGIGTRGEMDVIVHFPAFQTNWVISRRALEKVSDINGGDNMMEAGLMTCDSKNGLKIGDYVMMDPKASNFVITALQASEALQAQPVQMNRNSFRRIVSIDVKGVAAVSINDHQSVKVHPGLLKIRRLAAVCSPCSTLSQKYPIKREVLLKRNIAELVKLPSWNFELTQVLGGHGEVFCHLPNNLIGVKVNDVGYVITEKYIASKWKKNEKRTRRISGNKCFETSEDFPFMVNEKVLLKLAFDPACEILLKDLRLPAQFVNILQEEIYTVLGYHKLSQTVCKHRMLIFGRSVTNEIMSVLPANEFDVAEGEVAMLYEKWLTDTEQVQVGDEVIIRGAEHSTLVKHVLHRLLNVPPKLEKVLTSKVKLIAFDDENDEAILEVDDVFFACPASFICAPYHRKENKAEGSDASPGFPMLDNQECATANRLGEDLLVDSEQHHRLENRDHLPTSPSNEQSQIQPDVTQEYLGDGEENDVASVTHRLGEVRVHRENDDEEEIEVTEPEMQDISSEIANIEDDLPLEEDDDGYDIAEEERILHSPILQPPPISRAIGQLVEQTVHYTPQTKEIVVRCKLTNSSITSNPPQDIFSRQRSYVAPTNEDESPRYNSGSANITYNINNSNFDGNTVFGGTNYFNQDSTQSTDS